MGHKIREHMAAVDGEAPLGGIGKAVEVDETYVGGKVRGGQGGKGKAVVFGMLERGGDVISYTIPRRSGQHMLGGIVANVRPGTEIHTDEATQYEGLAIMTRYTHMTVNHGEKEYVGPKGETTNAIEGYFSQLKRTIQGTHIWVSPKYLNNYAKECEYRYNNRDMPNAMLPELLSVFPSQTWI